MILNMIAVFTWLVCIAYSANNIEVIIGLKKEIKEIEKEIVELNQELLEYDS